jgi:3-carboxy-cis,cis-muconate cycloisomerase
MAPQLAATILAAQVQEHERATGGWQAEWPTFPALLMAASAGLAAIVDIAEGLEVDPARMRANLDATHGLIMAEAVSFALAVKLGKSNAHKLVEEAGKQAVADKRPLQDVLADDKRVTAQLSKDDLARLFDPLSYQGAAQAFIDRQFATAKPNT